jgi:hypothetical protein
VRDAAGELAKGFHLLRLSELLLCALERGLRLLAFGDVACDVNEADQSADRIANRFDNGTRPEDGFIAPHALAFDAILALISGHLQGPLRFAALTFLFGIEPAKMLPDNFRRGVLVQPLGARVPMCDDAPRVEHEYRVVGDTLDDRPVSPITLDQRQLCAPTLGRLLLKHGFDSLSLLDFVAQDFAGTA